LQTTSSDAGGAAVPAVPSGADAGG
jgi:hypothetical protein